MNKFFLFSLITLFICFGKTSAQNRLEIDIDNIIFKAKLLTIANYGLLGREEIVDTIQNQKHFLYKPNEDYIIIKILHHQPFEVRYKNGKLYNSCENHFSNCEFVVIFSFKSYTFYRIKGFEINDFLSLYNEANSSTYTIYGLFTDEILSVTHLDLQYLINKYVKKNRRLKKKYEYCNQCTEPAKVY